MSFHEVPHDLDALDVSVGEGIVMIVITVTLNNLKNEIEDTELHRTEGGPYLLAEVTASPGLTAPATNPSMCVKYLTLRVVVHLAEDIVEVEVEVESCRQAPQWRCII